MHSRAVSRRLRATAGVRFGAGRTSAFAAIVVLAASTSTSTGCRGDGAPTSASSVPAVASEALPPGEEHPKSASGSTPAPGARFALFLHGLGDRGSSFARALDAAAVMRAAGLEHAAPDGAVDAAGRRHWNAGPVCCDFGGIGTDHVGELRRHMQARPTVVVGFSNGSFMAQRLACEAPEVVAIVSLAGGDPRSDHACKERRPIGIVHVHGSDDRVVPLRGGLVLGDAARPPIPAAEEVLLRWGERNGCDPSMGFQDRGRLDLSPSIVGSETRVQALSGCRAPVELWVMEGAGHLDVASPRVVRAALEVVL